MKKLILFLMVSVLVPIMAVSIEIGSKATLTEVKLLDVSGKKVSLTDVTQENGLLVIFSSNTCPFVLQWEARYPELKAWADKHKVGMIVLNSNYQNLTGLILCEDAGTGKGKKLQFLLCCR